MYEVKYEDQNQITFIYEVDDDDDENHENNDTKTWLGPIVSIFTDKLRMSDKD